MLRQKAAVTQSKVLRTAPYAGVALAAHEVHLLAHCSQSLPFAGYVARQRGEYLPLTLRMLEKVMRAKKWRAVEQ